MSSTSSNRCDFSGSASTSSLQDWNYHVFLSFRGKDTRNSFTGHLVAALKQTGLRIFIDDDELPKGEKFPPQLRKAIQESRICIIVFSKNYASSRWCLDELLEILECNKHSGNIVLPIFYDVDPCDVRYQRGSFADFFTSHEQRFISEMDRKKMETWRSALSEVVDFSGYSLKTDSNGNEARLIENIVGDVLLKAEPINSNIFFENLVGLDSRVEEIVSLLSLESNDVRMLGIYGLGGIGKTTTAKAVFNKILHKFECSYFAENVKDAVQKDGLVSLQQQLLSEIMKRNVTFGNANKGSALMKERCRSKKLLIILDDVDDAKQIKLLAGQKHWLGSGSRIIITTRDVQLLNQARVDNRYEVEELNESESMELFCWHAFNKPSPLEEFESLSKEAVHYCGGLPLALEVIGAYLIDKSTLEWKSGIEKLSQVPNNEIQEKLKVSFDALGDDKVKAVFLDIACLFVGETKGYVVNLCNACGFFAEDAISNLTRKCLLKVSFDRLTMHDHIRDMGREIIRKESPNHPENRSRLWHLTEVVDVLQKNKGTEAVEAIKLDLTYSERKKFSTRLFKNMTSLRFLQIDNVDLTGSFKNLFGELKMLRWRKNTMKNLPFDFKPEKLVILDMQRSQFIALWHNVKRLENLTILDLTGCKCLRTTPDFSGVKSLQEIVLADCTSLSKFHPSIGLLIRLRILNLSMCEGLYMIPEFLCDLESLEELILDECSNLKSLPDQIGKLKCLKRLKLLLTPIKHLPESIGLLSRLEFLYLDCGNITTLPNSICDLESLGALCIRSCSRMQKRPENVVERMRYNSDTEYLSQCRKLLDRMEYLCSNCRYHRAFYSRLLLIVRNIVIVNKIIM